MPQWFVSVALATTSGALGAATAWGRASARLADLDATAKKLADEVRALTVKLGEMAERVAVLQDRNAREARESGVRGRR